MEIKTPSDDWKCDGWNEPVKARREMSAKMTFRERLLWLEQITAFARKLKDAPTTTPPGFAEKPPEAVAEEQAPYSSGPNPGQ